MDEMFNKLVAEIEALRNSIGGLEKAILQMHATNFGGGADQGVVESESDTTAEKPASKTKKSSKKSAPKKPESKEQDSEPTDAEIVEPEKPQEPEKKPEPEVTYTDADVRAALSEVMNTKSTAIAKDIINGVGNAQNVSGIAPEKYAGVIAACKEALK